MEDLLKCPICCNETFDSKESLLRHITNILENLHCPVCKNKWTTLENLAKHLAFDKCQKEESTIVLDNDLQHTIHVEDNEIHKVEFVVNKIPEEQFGSVYKADTPMVTGEVSKMYVELLSKQLAKPCLQTQELKLVKEDGENHYMIITQPNSELNEYTVVTKQNNDGTISLTAVNDVKLETDTLLTPTENELDDSQEEIYTCNTCGVSFSSVLEHIQNYHNDQLVVVEDEGENDPESDLPNNEDIGQMPRRVITDTGDIVEAPVRNKISVSIQEPRGSDKNGKDLNNPQGRVPTARFVQIENLCDSVVKDIKSNESVDNLAYHKVVVKKMKVQNGATPLNMYHCKSCEIYAASLDDLRSRPCKSPIYACPHCNSVFETSKSLCLHMKLHKDINNPAEIIPEVPVSYECELCGTIFPTNKSLKLHKRMHDPLKSRPIELPVENKDGTEVTKSIYICQICDKVIPTDYRQVHQNSHMTSNKYHCAVCNKKFTSSEYLEMHMNVHNLDKVTVNKQDKSLPYNCSYCTRRFARPHEKVKHERIHTGEKPHSCDICGKSFRVSYCLTLHMRTHTGARPYACSHCGKRFKAHSVYNHHLLTHSDVRAYKCPYCPKAFKTSVQLAGHKNSHTKPFSCQHCNRPFASLYAVRVHTETHARQNNLKFSCALCGASYARAFALKDHIKQTHEKDVDTIDNAITNDENWSVKETDSISGLTRELSQQGVELGMNSNELIVP